MLLFLHLCKLFFSRSCLVALGVNLRVQPHMRDERVGIVSHLIFSINVKGLACVLARSEYLDVDDGDVEARVADTVGVAGLISDEAIRFSPTSGIFSNSVANPRKKR